MGESAKEYTDGNKISIIKTIRCDSILTEKAGLFEESFQRGP